MYLFTAARSILGPSQAPFPGGGGKGVGNAKFTTHLHLMPTRRMVEIYLLPPPIRFMALYLINSFALLTLWSWALLERPPVMQPLKNFPAFYGTRKFQTDQFKSHHPILLLQDPSQYYSLIYILDLLLVSFPLIFQPITYTRASSPLFVLHAPPISSSST
jgi:hypothetical protein